MPRKFIIILTLAVAASLAALAKLEAAYEEPTYELVSSDGDFELRRYQPYLVAVTLAESRR